MSRLVPNRATSAFVAVRVGGAPLERGRREPDKRPLPVAAVDAEPAARIRVYRVEPPARCASSMNTAVGVLSHSYSGWSRIASSLASVATTTLSSVSGSWTVFAVPQPPDCQRALVTQISPDLLEGLHCLLAELGRLSDPEIVPSSTSSTNRRRTVSVATRVLPAPVGSSTIAFWPGPDADGCVRTVAEVLADVLLVAVQRVELARLRGRRTPPAGLVSLARVLGPKPILRTQEIAAGRPAHAVGTSVKPSLGTCRRGSAGVGAVDRQEQIRHGSAIVDEALGFSADQRPRGRASL